MALRGGSRPRARAVLLATALATALAVGSAACTAPSAGPAVPVPAGPSYPRTAAVYLAQDALPPAAALAARDVVVIDSEWSHRMPASYFAEVRRLHPAIVLLAYVNIVDRPTRIGTEANWSDRYALWQFDAEGRSRLPEPWMARTAAGAAVSEYPDTTMTNLTDTAPTVDGTTFRRHAVDWMVSTVWASGVWDGLFLDVWGDRIFTADATAWDVTGTGADVPDAQIYGQGMPWERGITDVEDDLRGRLPDAVLVANGDRTPERGLLNGLVYESFADRLLAQRDPGSDLRRYLTTGTDPQLRAPSVTITLDRRPANGPLTADDRRRARYFLGMTLLQNGYWASMGMDYESIAQYDELDGGGAGAGYLGPAVSPDPSVDQVLGPYADGVGAVLPGVLRRDFRDGIALVNTGSAEAVVPLGGEFRGLRGSADPAAGEGAAVTSATLPPEDGIVLLRG